MKNLIKHTLQKFGYDIVRIPYPGSQGRMLQKLIARDNINCILDVGARHGEYTTWLRSIGYTGWIISFEPVAANFKELSKQHSQDPRWKGYQMAIGAKETILDINVATGSALSSFLTTNNYAKATFAEEAKIDHKESVRVAPLSALIREIRTIVGSELRCYLKMDTQGFDLEVMQGAIPCLNKILSLQSEVSVQPIYENMPAFQEAIKTYESYGFSLVGLYAVKQDQQDNVIEFDCLMQRAPTE